MKKGASRRGTPLFPGLSKPRLAPRREISDGFLEVLRGAEGDLLARLDLDRFAGRRVAAHARRALPHLEDAEARDADFVALFQVLTEIGDEVLEHLVARLLGDGVLLRHGGGDVLEGDGLGIGHWDRSLLSFLREPPRRREATPNRLQRMLKNTTFCGEIKGHA